MIRSLIKILALCALISMTAKGADVNSPRDPFMAMTAPASFITQNADGTIGIDANEVKASEILKSLAQYAGKNIIVSDAVTGNLTLHLKHVSWQEALQAILTTKALVQRQQNKVIFIFPSNDSKSFETGLPAELITVHYAKATDLLALLKGPDNSLLSKSGYISADPRTNALWLQDTPERLQVLRHFISRLDVPVQQVLIKAKIVNVDEAYLKELGIQFGTVTTHSPQLVDGLNMDIPTIAANTAGQFNLAIAKLGANTLLDLELSALESAGHGKIISSPELTAADRTAAYIESGDEVPYQEKAASGATTVAFKKAVLSLKVIPQITSANTINLNLTVSQDKLSPVDVHGVPAIQKREVQTQVHVRSGQTLVLGGIYEQSNSHTTERIPFLSSIPVAGALFRNNIDRNDRKELLIFVTPEIVK